MYNYTIQVAIIALIISGFGSYLSEGCNYDICGEAIGNCRDENACDEDILECAKCLGEKLYMVCCDCLDSCPIYRGRVKSQKHISMIERYKESNPELFYLLTEHTSRFKENWSMYSFSNEINFSVNPPEIKTIELDRAATETQVNCTVAFHKKCLNWNDCQEICGEIGSNGYRWFNDGCCECFGDHCHKHGTEENRCDCEHQIMQMIANGEINQDKDDTEKDDAPIFNEKEKNDGINLYVY